MPRLAAEPARASRVLLRVSSGPDGAAGRCRVCSGGSRGTRCREPVLLRAGLRAPWAGRPGRSSLSRCPAPAAAAAPRGLLPAAVLPQAGGRVTRPPALCLGPCGPCGSRGLYRSMFCYKVRAGTHGPLAAAGGRQALEEGTFPHSVGPGDGGRCARACGSAVRPPRLLAPSGCVAPQGGLQGTARRGTGWDPGKGLRVRHHGSSLLAKAEGGERRAPRGERAVGSRRSHPAPWSQPAQQRPACWPCHARATAVRGEASQGFG